MDTKELEKFCPWARRELIDAVDLRCHRFALDPDGLAANPADSDVVAGRVLSPQEKAQRAKLAERIGARGYDAFCQEMAYTWFNRFAAIRFMEVHGYLPSYVRMFSNSEDGSFRPDSISCAADLDLPGLDKTEILNLMVKGDDEEVFRRVIVAQCNELAECLPEVFGQVDDADALTLPDGLLNSSEHSVLYHMVEDIPEEVWDDVEVLGWMYQFYNAELKDAFFKSKRKASAADIAPATQLFTPEWIVRYMVENSLGRLWMLNHPESHLRDRMEYYIEPDAEHEDFIRVESPEDITLCDPACGSGHILSYAFELLYAIYEECGYIAREIPELILTKNLSGYEIDPRAAQIASLVLALRAREHDRRFFRRDVRADVRVLESVPLEEGETGLPKKLAEELSHLGEIGSLLVPTDEDMDVIRAELASRAGDLFAATTKDGLEGALETCEALRRRFDVVVANPPYMGLRKLNNWYAEWTRNNYPTVNSDLYSCFIERSFDLTKGKGYTALVTMATWMTDKGLLGLRQQVIEKHPVIGMLKMDANVMPIAFETSAAVFYNNPEPGQMRAGLFAQVSQEELNESRSLQSDRFSSLSTHSVESQVFKQLPDSIIVTNASDRLIESFNVGQRLSNVIQPRVGIQTGDTARFIRHWWEVSRYVGMGHIANQTDNSHGEWVPSKNGGLFRKWFGNDDSVIRWGKAGEVVIGKAADENRKIMGLPAECQFKPFVSWSEYGLGKTSFRLCIGNSLFDVIEPAFIAQEAVQTKTLLKIMAFLNSSVAGSLTSVLMPGRHKNVRKMGLLPFRESPGYDGFIAELASECQTESKLDWDSLETSWDFKRSPLL